MPAGYKKLSTQSGGARDFLRQLFSQIQGQSTNIGQNPLFQQGQSYLQNLLSGSPEATQAFEAPYMRQFQEQILPMIAERFSGLGAGSQSSSAFKQALGQAGAGLQEQLASLRSGLQFQGAGQALNYAQQPISNLLGFGQLGLGTQTKAYAQKPQSFIKQLLLGLSGGVGQAGGAIGSAYGLNKLGLT